MTVAHLDMSVSGDSGSGSSLRSTEAERSYQGWCTYLRVIATMMVILLHASGPWLLDQPIGTRSWALADLIESFVRPSVPLFFMISGYLLAGSASRSFADFAKRRLARIGPAFISVTAFAIAWRYANGEHLTGDIAWQWLVTPQFYHLWFFYALAFVYLALWVVQPPNVNPVAGALCCFALIVWVGGGLAQYVSGTALHAETYASDFLYAIAGHYIGRVPLRKSAALIAIGIAVVALGIVAVATYNVSLQAGSLDQRYFVYETIPIVIASFAMFYAARFLLGMLRRPGPVVEILAASSLVIYAGHPFVIDAAFRLYPDLARHVNSPVGLTLLLVTSCVILVPFASGLRWLRRASEAARAEVARR